MKNLFLSTVIGVSLASPVVAQDSFDVRQAMETVRKENLQRIGVERQQQIVSTLRKRAEDLAAISEAGFVVTPDGRLEPMESGPAPGASNNNASGNLQSGSLPNGQAETGGLFSEGGSDMISEGALSSVMNPGLDSSSDPSSEGGIAAISLKAILSDRAVLRVNGSEKRYQEGDELPNGFTVVAVNSRSVDVKKGESGIETLYMDWSSASKSAQAGSGPDGLGSEPRTFMQSGQPVEGFGGGF